MMFSQLKNLAFELRLFGIKANAQRRCEAVSSDNLHPAEVIRLLLEDEKLARREAAAKRMVAQARFRNACHLEDWDSTYDRGLSKAKFKELALLRFYHKLENLIILGKTGVGKTHLGIALGNRICREANSTLFFSANLFFEEVQAEKVAGTYLKFIKKLAKTRALILDDFGLRTYTHDEATALLEILEERYGKGITIITSQVAPKGWIKLFEDPVVAEAVVDRLCNPACLIELTGESYRKKRKIVDPS
jgi:DNA replication protein DnaC